jgi:broad specificity phosphatase PhoE
MGVILLVRHGQASWGAEDYDQLSGRGTEQAGLVGRCLAERGVRPTVLVSGAMRRHVQTTSAMRESAGWDAEAVVDDGWNEFDHVQMLEVHGPPDGAEPGAQLSRQEFNAWFDAATVRWTSGEHDSEYDEPFAAFTERVQSALRRTAGRLGSGDVAVVSTSGGPISWVAATLLGGGTDTWGRLNPVMVNASLTKVVVGSRGTSLVSFNEHGHLEPDAVTYR